MADDINAYFARLIDEAVDAKLPALVEAKVREVIGEMVIASVPAHLLPEVREHQEAIAKALRERLGA